ncbi:MAG: hypothetical protein CM1200mP22_15040 [Dehalococcoidia bacterium]|nr:MAG: hypothetical protein CM1200mP22_15040 [Dehalococcoidia bacterium]
MKHAFRNALIPPLTFAGVTLGALVTGSLVVETVFAWPGLGRLAIEALFAFDYPLLQGVVITFTLLYVTAACRRGRSLCLRRPTHPVRIGRGNRSKKWQQILAVLSIAPPTFGEKVAGIYRKLKRLPVIPVFLLSLVVIAGLFAPVLAPHDPEKGDLRERNIPPAWSYGRK